MRASRGRLFFGIIVIAAGIIGLLKVLGMLPVSITFGNLIPIFIILLGLDILLSSRSKFVGLLFVAFGTLYLLNNINYLTIDIRQSIFWVFVIIFGLMLIFGSFTRRAHIFNNSTVTAENFPDYVSIFGGQEVVNNSQNFKGGKITAIFGGVTLDLRNAEIDGEEAYIDAVTMFGGAEIFVPERWQVITKGVPIFGGFSNKKVNQNNGPDAKKLIVNGTAIFGGVDIK